MSVALKPVITQAGLEAVMNASGDSLQARITHIALGDVGYEPDRLATTLKKECHRVPISQGRRITPNQIHITAIENGNQSYWVREVGFILSDGTLLAIWSHPDQALAYKADDVDLLLAFDLVLSALPAESIIIDGTGSLDLAPATNTKVGLVRLATTTEAQAGIISTGVAITPAGARVHGDLRYPLRIHRHDWNQIDKKPASYPPASHNHDAYYAPKIHRHRWDEIDGKPLTYKSAMHDHDGRYAFKVHRHRWDDIDGKPLTYKSAVHDHDGRYAFRVHRHSWDDIDGKPATYPSTAHNHDERYAQQSGTYLNLRAQATTKADVGLANVPNYPISSSVTDSSNNKFATAGAVKTAYDAAKAKQLVGGEEQISGYLYYTASEIEGESFPMVMDYTVPQGCVMVGLYSDYSMLSSRQKRWRVRYRSIDLV